VEIWEFVNNGGGWVHPIHLHMANFKILSRNGRAPRPWERGWKETVFLDGNETARVLIKFPEVPVEGTGEYTRRYAYHCHLVEHEDHDMMLQFEVRA
jgi:spore coat protein A